MTALAEVNSTLAAINSDLLDRFIAYVDATERTIDTYRKALKQFFVYLKDHSINQPSRTDVLSYRDELKETHKPATVQTYIIAIRQFFKWTEIEGIYPDIADHVKGAKVDREHKKDYLTSAQVKAVMTGIDRTTEAGLRDYAVLALMFTAGLRTIEVSRANIEDLRTAGDQTVLYVQGKGHDEKAEFVKVAPATEQAIREYLKCRKVKNSKEPLFCSTSNNSAGGRLSTRSISGIVKSHLIDAGYNSDRLTAHSTRHTAVTLALLNGQSLEAVQQFARHSNIATTQIYAHHLDKAQNKCSSVIADAIF